MKLLVLSHMFPNRHAPFFGVFVCEQLKALDRLGVSARVISPVPFSPRILWFNKKWKNYGDIPLEEDIDGIKVSRPRYLAFPKRIMFEKSGWFYYLGIRKFLREILKDLQINLIHSHSALPDGQAALYIKKRLNIPYVLTIHGDDLQNTIYQGRSRKGAIEKVIKESAITIVVSNKLNKIVEEHFPEVPGNKVVVIGNGIDQNVFKSLPKRFPRKREFMILSVGHLIKIKGHDIFLQVLAKLVKKYTIKYNIVGGGAERSNLEKIVKDKNLGRIVNFFGPQPHEEIPKFMKEADLFVLPSWKEGFGIVYLEAMASGLPVIGCKGQGVEDFVKDGEAGFLVKPKDSNDLYTACAKILSNQKLYEQMSKKAIKIASNYTWQKNAERTLQVYKQVSGKKIIAR
ncbi:MAG TPA: glycosyltransferase family 4 protein [Candidatus Nanoarchaeia archaeon]